MMKKILSACVVTFACVLLVGCSEKPQTKKTEYPWGVVMIMKYNLTTENLPMDSVDEISEYMQSLVDDYNMDCLINQSGKTLQLQFDFKKNYIEEQSFGNYLEFMRFNNTHITEEELWSVVDYEIKKDIYFYERTQKFTNPITLIDRTRLTEIDQFMRSSLDGTVNGAFDLIYVLESSIRRTKVDGSYKNENNVTSYAYYFDTDSTEIIIFDRYENQVSWYLTGLVLAVLFMVLVFVIYNKRKTKRVDETLTGF